MESLVHMLKRSLSQIYLNLLSRLNGQKMAVVKSRSFWQLEFFLVAENITAAKTVVYGVINEFSIPFPVDQPDACKDQGITCPMTAGMEYKFKTVLPIKSFYPKVSVTQSVTALLDNFTYKPQTQWEIFFFFIKLQ